MLEANYVEGAKSEVKGYVDQRIGELENRVDQLEKRASKLIEALTKLSGDKKSVPPPEVKVGFDPELHEEIVSYTKAFIESKKD